MAKLTSSRTFSEATERLFSAGHRVGEVARSLFPGGVLIETGGDLRAAIEKTREVLAGPGDRTIFEPTFEHQGVLVKADVLLRKRGRVRLIEVKAAGGVKDHYFITSTMSPFSIGFCGAQVTSLPRSTSRISIRVSSIPATAITGDSSNS